MIAEFDDMVGLYIKAIDEAGLTDSTVIAVSSDHGDMQMEHAQFYKMVAYEASTRVPVVMAGPGINHVGDGNIQTLTSLVDLLPTFLEIAGGETKSSLEGGLEDPETVDGTSLVPLLIHGDARASSHPDHVISQFHGENLAMSWYMVRQGEMKYVAWGTGEQHEPQLFNLTADPDEWTNLAAGYGVVHGRGVTEAQLLHREHRLIRKLDQLLLSSVDYPSVTKDVANYNVKMARWWMQTEPKWQSVLAGGQAVHPQASSDALNADWGELWQERPDKYWSAWWDWLNRSTASAPDIPTCPTTLVHDWQ
jgi:hypothetical protein